MPAASEDPRSGPILTTDEAVQAFYFLLRLMTAESRAMLLYKMRNHPDSEHGERHLLIRALIQFEADLEASAWRNIVVVGPNQAPPAPDGAAP